MTDPPAEFPEKSEAASLVDDLLLLKSRTLDDLERLWVASNNRRAQLTRTEPDKDGRTRGFGFAETHPYVLVQAGIAEAAKQMLDEAERQLKAELKACPLHSWINSVPGVGEKQAARLLGAIGDPYLRPAHKLEDGTLIPARVRTVNQLWTYCGYNTVDGKARHKTPGQQANWNHLARSRAYLIAVSCLKRLVAPCESLDGEVKHVEDCRCSPYRLVYDNRRRHTAQTHPEWTPMKSHCDGLRVAAKEMLKDLWKEAQRLHAKQ